MIRGAQLKIHRREGNLEKLTNLTKGLMVNRDFSKALIDESVMDNILRHSAIAKDIRRQYLNRLSRDKRTLLKQYFHLRPGGSGITLYSTYSDWAMRGSQQVSTVKIQHILSQLEEQLEKSSEVGNVDFGKIVNNSMLEKHTKIDEDALQARMISEMIQGNPKKYNGVQFLASEIILSSKNPRFDIIGFHPEEERLYIFELKAKRENAVFQQVQEYREYLKKRGYMKSLSDVLAAYPADCQLPSRSYAPEDVYWVVVMPGRQDGNNTKGLNRDRINDIQCWFYSYGNEGELLLKR